MRDLHGLLVSKDTDPEFRRPCQGKNDVLKWVKLKHQHRATTLGSSLSSVWVSILVLKKALSVNDFFLVKEHSYELRKAHTCFSQLAARKFSIKYGVLRGEVLLSMNCHLMLMHGNEPRVYLMPPFSPSYNPKCGQVWQHSVL